MIKKIFIVCLLSIFFIQAQANSEKTEIKIGVLAKRGAELTLKRWGATANYLSTRLPNYHFTLVPLDFESIQPAIKEKQIDLLLVNSGMYVNLSFTYKLRPVATLKRRIFNQGFTRFGSVVFTLTERQDITRFEDIAGKKVGAVNADSFGGWNVALRELEAQGIGPDRFASLSFLGTHDAVVNAVLNKEIDVGIVRTDTLEQMDAEGKIELGQFRHLESDILKTPIYAQQASRFPFKLSSRLYPEWPMVSLDHVPEPLSEKISRTLIDMPMDDPAAISGRVTGWTIPKNYREVELLYNELKLGIFAELSQFTLQDIIKRYWLYFATAFFFISSLIGVLSYIYQLNKKLKESREQMIELATHDLLTALPNRRLFFELAHKYLAMAKRDGQNVKVLFLDLDRFKPINDQYGHDAGDLVLKTVAERISKCLRSSDIVARIGGDEFLLMLWDIKTPAQFDEITKRLLKNIASPITGAEGVQLEVGCSIGASCFCQDDEDLDKLIKKADLALYKAKEQGRGQVVNYSDEMDVSTG